MAFATMDDYVAAQPDDVQDVLNRVRALALAAVPDGEEAITYQMPTIKRDGRNVIHFAAWKKHLAIYPIPEGDEAFFATIAPYATYKGTLHFTYSQGVPYDVVADVFGRLAEVD